MGGSLGCPSRRARLQLAAIERWRKVIKRLLEIRWLQRVFYAVGWRLKQVPQPLRDRLAITDPPIQ